MASGKFGLGISIKVDTKKMAREILKEAVKRINRNIEGKINTIEKIIGERFVSRIKETPEYESLSSDRGKLRLEFGIPNPDYVLGRILSKLKLCFDVEYKKARVVNDRIEGTFSVTFNKQDFSFLYEEASFRAAFGGTFKQKVPSSFKTDKGDKIDWLRWLLESGTSPIIQDYRVKFGSNLPTSRTGGAIMVATYGSSWGVTQFAGTSSDNWLTRTLAEYEKEIEGILNTIIQGGLKDVGN